MAQRPASNRASTRVAIRLIPIFIICAFLVTTYIVVGHICVQYYIQDRARTGFAAGMLVLYFVLFLLTMSAYVRTFVAVLRDPGLVPLANNDIDAANEKLPPRRRRRRRRGEQEPDIEAQEWTLPDMSPDSPGLERFYSKDVFACEADGRPRWCSSCCQWKPDRAHHSSELGRCVRKMDHLCPWVGGMVSETSFNFFAQFTFYCALYCSFTLALSGYTLSQQQHQQSPLSPPNKTPDGWVVAALVLSAFFLLFSGGMALTSLRYILTNLTNIDMFSRNRISYLAVRVPLASAPSDLYPTIVYPLQQPTLLLPPAAGALPPPPVNSCADQLAAAGSAGGAGETDAGAPPSDAISRDQRAQRKFAILRVESRENPWDLGFGRNWTSVMGHCPLEWILPIRHSPCCQHDSMESDYPTGRLLETLKQRYHFPGYENTGVGSITEPNKT